jgi:hypothetical protein
MELMPTCINPMAAKARMRGLCVAGLEANSGKTEKLKEAVPFLKN